MIYINKILIVILKFIIIPSNSSNNKKNMAIRSFLVNRVLSVSAIFIKIKKNFLKFPSILRNKLPILYQKVTTSLVHSWRLYSTKIMVLENFNVLLHDLSLTRVRAQCTIYTFACVLMRIVRPEEAIVIRLLSRSYALANNLYNLKYYGINEKILKKISQNIQILVFSVYGTVNIIDKGNLKSEVYQRFLHKKFNLEGDYIVDSKMFYNVPPFSDMEITDFLDLNLKHMIKHPLMIPFDGCFAFNYEMKKLLNSKNIIQSDQEETNVLKFYKIKRQIRIKDPKTLSLIDPIKTRILVRYEKIANQLSFEKFSNPLVISTDEISDRNISKWHEQKNDKKNLSEENTNPAQKNEIILSSVAVPQEINSFMVKQSHINYYMAQERRYIKEIAMDNLELSELSGAVLLDKLAYRKMLQDNLKSHTHRLKVLRRVQTKMTIRSTSVFTKFIRKIFLL